MSTNRDLITTTSSAPPIFPSSNNNNDLVAEAQKRIVAGLLSQQPTIVQAAVSGSTSPHHHHHHYSDIDYTNIIQTLHALGQTNTSLSEVKPFQLVMNHDPNVWTTLIKSEEIHPSASSSPSSTATAVSNGGTSNTNSTSSNEPEYKPRNVREKVYADGYIMSFDKKSCCGTKYFWRCERKNDCNARMHSDIVTREIVRKLHPHNHDKPSPEELAFYEQDFSVLDPNYCHPVKSINRSYMQRKLSRVTHFVPQTQPPSQLPEPMEIETNQTFSQSFPQNNMILLASAMAAASASARISPPIIGQKRVATTMMPIKLKSPRSIKQEENETSQLLSQEEFRVTYEITRKLMELMKPKTEIGVRWQGDEDSLLLFLSQDSGADENVFFPVVVMNRNERSLITALEGFAGKRCEGKIALCYSQKVHVLVHEALISNWTHGKLFLVNSDSSALWRLTPVDAFGEPVNHA
ncbi:CBN-FLH-2 protein [Caenorhabditis brenneri]|uniref:CBN-FLH-2 protein n=1 Tax=Caenorhabditis brenneri TaxID=135651 RepID=G0MEL8_CAEBE|nr:CBN-FLH-2 protein [Caenorhabditis brenneri]